MIGKIKVCFVDTLGLTYTGDTLSRRGLGGSESAVILLTKELSKLGLDITVFNHCEKEGDFEGVRYFDLSRMKDIDEDFNIMISSRTCLPYVPEQLKEDVMINWDFDLDIVKNIVDRSHYKVVWMHDTFCEGDNYMEGLYLDGYIDELFTLSDWHSQYVANAAHNHPQRYFKSFKNKIWQTRNGIVSYYNEVDLSKKDKNSFIYNASVSKGLEPLLHEVWPRVKEELPDAKLTIIGGYYKQDNEPDELEEQYRKEREYFENKLDISFTGIIKQDEVAKVLTTSSFFIYPGVFPETYGISTLEAINYHVPLIGCRFGALEEVAAEGTSYLIDFPFDYDEQQLERFVDKVIEAYNDEYLLQQKQQYCNAFKQWIGWNSVALQWKQHFCNVLNIPMELQELKQVRKINTQVIKLFNRKFINNEDYFDNYESDYKQHLMIISPVYNAEKYIDKCIKSVANQLYEDYTMYIIDDCSTDNTEQIAKSTISSLPEYLQDKFIFLSSDERSGAAIEHQYNIINYYSNENDIAILLDGDDWLANDVDIFNYINRQYIEEEAWMTYGSCKSLVDNIDLIAQPYPDKVHNDNSYRSYLFNWGMPYTHLRTFKVDLFKRIQKEDLLDEHGNFYGPGGDNALIYPLLEMTPKDNIKVIQKVLYIYNDLNELNDYKIEDNAERQNTNASIIRNKEVYNKTNKHKRILIAIPTAKNIETDTFKSIYDLQKPKNCTVDLEFFYGYNIDQVRNLIAHYAIENNYDYLFSVDSDIEMPSDTLIKLLKQDTDIISGLYVQRNHSGDTELYLEDNNDNMFNIPASSLIGSGIIEVAGCGMGCVLIKTEVLFSIGYPFFEYHSSINFEDTISEDIDFCIKAKQKGYKIFADNSVKCNHIGNRKFTFSNPF